MTAYKVHHVDGFKTIPESTRQTRRRQIKQFRAVGAIEHAAIGGVFYPLRYPSETASARATLAKASIFSTPVLFGPIGQGKPTGQHLVQSAE